MVDAGAALSCLLPLWEKVAAKRPDEGVPAWQRRQSVQHPSSVLALRANPPSPTRGEGKATLT
ncbi:hypothetical protein EOA60_28875 [Mesorhizobium sp. M1A.F.Ca.IN.020.06.1.1]|nr:hypothetical protein CK214_16955 [Mesorhizobium sp. WSM3882]RUV06057.1 hypothetical protein EOA79_10495 [Mesorhizobium sp. M1A.F.Ca.IN.020.03.2.1]RUV85446.1 hypothetical protein EOA51_18340 [Mesorhizobium sp. M1A.F.Ca.IN.020.32.1.1]RUW09605.1 hypothetical protein EOA46_17605 [Mesorhizobium sp. M1A.F.Ca.IN.022.05.2.1]RUW18459.1 hypothetical protein EOA60_28875 [Mesorhizobium sp. M1A.F.Ca.IN.020.06.1.1]RWG96090.1 MAG: hypothetical protein EOQ73_28095 [Mesorhizobium sp.]